MHGPASRGPQLLLATSLAGLGLAALATTGAGQAPSPLWFDLDPGPHPVGFEVRYEVDASREFAEPGAGRPIRLFLWYPAARTAAEAPNLAWEAYLDPAPGDRTEAPPAAYVRFLLDKETDTARRQFSPLDDALFRTLLATEVAAKDAPPWADGRHPLVLHSLGLNDFQQESTVLWEYLASHGYVVAVVPQVGPSASDAGLDFEPEDLGVQVEDLAFALATIETAGLPVDASDIGVIGHSFGGIAAFMLALREARVRAIAGLDGSFSTGDGAALFSTLEFPFDELSASILDARTATKPILDRTALDSATGADRFEAEIGGDAPPAIATHFDFQNWPVYGALAGVEDDRGAGARSLDAGRTFYLAAVRLTRLFLDHAIRGDDSGLPILEGRADLPGIDPAWIEVSRVPGSP